MKMLFQCQVTIKAKIKGKAILAIIRQQLGFWLYIPFYFYVFKLQNTFKVNFYIRTWSLL